MRDCSLSLQIRFVLYWAALWLPHVTRLKGRAAISELPFSILHPSFLLFFCFLKGTKSQAGTKPTWHMSRGIQSVQKSWHKRRGQCALCWSAGDCFRCVCSTSQHGDIAYTPRVSGQCLMDKAVVNLIKFHTAAQTLKRTLVGPRNFGESPGVK